ncbi:hypothetical protein HYW67_02285 [Candidatus Parcubacteria bacterium]|nr:hypothetical protein [Candidatus Parcubacteria bacterium]
MAEDRAYDQLSESARTLESSMEEIRTLTGTRRQDADAQFAFIREPLVAMAAKALEGQLKKFEPALTVMGIPEAEAKKRLVGIFEDALERVKRQQPQRFEMQEL